MKTLYVGNDNTVMLTCPACDKAKTVDVGKYLAKDGPVTFTYRFQCDACRCGHDSCQDCVRENCSLGKVNSVRLERRRNVRKEIALLGKLLSAGRNEIPIRIHDLSRRSVRVEFAPQATPESGRLAIVDFELDDPHHTRVRKRVKIEGRSGNQAILLFVDDEPFSAADKAIGFYLMNTGQ
jgi:hypothetical protein